MVQSTDDELAKPLNISSSIQYLYQNYLEIVPMCTVTLHGISLRDDMKTYTFTFLKMGITMMLLPIIGHVQLKPSECRITKFCWLNNLCNLKEL